MARGVENADAVLPQFVRTAARADDTGDAAPHAFHDGVRKVFERRSKGGNGVTLQIGWQLEVLNAATKDDSVSIFRRRAAQNELAPGLASGAECILADQLESRFRDMLPNALEDCGHQFGAFESGEAAKKQNVMRET